MRRVGVLSDTHNCFDNKLEKFFANVDELWHAGDIGSLELADRIASFKPLKAVSGNIDDNRTRIVHPDFLRFNCENVNVLIHHITGYPGRYSTNIRAILKVESPKILVGGHSHILRVIYDKDNHLLYINPGAAGQSGFHTVRTAVRFEILGENIQNMEIGEWKRQ